MTAEGIRVCKTCQVPYLLTASNFYVSSSAPGGFVLHCKACKRAEKRAYDAGARKLPQLLGPDRMCRECCGLAYRVEGANCKRCGLAYRPGP